MSFVNSPDQLHFSDEDTAVVTFSISLASQHDLQAILNQADNHFDSCSIREHAHLNVLVHSFGTSGGWLKAIPYPWSRIRCWLESMHGLVPFSPLYTCLNCFGDHLLGCSHGPITVCYYNALFSILHHASLQDHTGVLKEQQASFDDNSCTGGYQYGCPAYFDVSICSITQFSYRVYISSSASFAGVVASAGEVATDVKHQAMGMISFHKL